MGGWERKRVRRVGRGKLVWNSRRGERGACTCMGPLNSGNDTGEGVLGSASSSLLSSCIQLIEIWQGGEGAPREGGGKLRKREKRRGPGRGGRERGREEVGLASSFLLGMQQSAHQ